MNNRLNEYLDDLESRLRFLPEADRQQEINEIRPHLQSLIAAHQSEGQNEDAAAQAALHQFGTARAIGSRIGRVERRKRLAQTAETVVFCAAFHGVYSVFEQGILHTWQAVVPLPEELHALLCDLPLSLLAVGFATFMALVWRFGWRGTAQKACENGSPVSAALRFVFLVNLVLVAHNFFLSFLSSAFPTTALRVSDIAESVGFLFGLCWLGAFFVGRGSTFRGSVSGSVGVAAALIPALGLLGVTITYVPSFTEFLKAWPGYLMGAACWVVPGLFFVLFVRFGVQMGEKARLNSHYAKIG